jgi:hypothetical protein
MVENEGEEQRGDALSHVVQVNCLALVSGPAVGGLLWYVDFRAPLDFALVLCAVAHAWIVRSRFAESPRRKKLRFGWRRPFQISLPPGDIQGFAVQRCSSSCSSSASRSTKSTSWCV